jgi:hypothetical protein
MFLLASLIMAQGYWSMAKSSKFEEHSNYNISKKIVSKLL